MPNTRYKTLVFKYLCKQSASHQVRCNWTGKKPAIPNDFIPQNVGRHLWRQYKLIEKWKLRP